MLGIIRFFLASCVIIFHLSAQIPHIGLLAVNFFYVISGYLITLILNETYSFKIREFSINRFLRLYPTYYFIALIAVAFSIIPISGTTSIGFHKNTTGIYQPLDLIANIFIFPFALINDASITSVPWLDSMVFGGYRFRWLSTSWSVAVELVCYMLLFIFVARRLSFALLSMIASVAFQAMVIHYNQNILINYNTVMAALMPFSLGSTAYFLCRYLERHALRIQVSNRNQIYLLMLVLIAFLVNWFFASKSYGAEIFTSPLYYVNTFIAFASVIIFHNVNPHGRLGSLSKVLGDLSYPIFLCHFLCAYIAWQILGRPEQKLGWDTFFLAYPMSLALGYCTIKLIDRPIQRIRNKVRPKKEAQ